MKLSPDLQVGLVRAGELRAPNRNIRRHSKRQLAALKASLKEFGLIRPVLGDKDKSIIDGVAIWMAASELRFNHLPVIFVEYLTAEQVRLYRIADNKLAEFGCFDEDALRLELGDLGELSVKLDLELRLETTGFSTKEVDDLLLRPLSVLDNEATAGGDDEQEPEAPEGPAVSRTDDLWLIGHHRILCGNSLDGAAYAALFGEERTQMVVADGPYNKGVRDHVSSRKDAREFARSVQERTLVRHPWGSGPALPHFQLP